MMLRKTLEVEGAVAVSSAGRAAAAGEGIIELEIIISHFNVCK